MARKATLLAILVSTLAGCDGGDTGSGASGPINLPDEAIAEDIIAVSHFDLTAASIDAVEETLDAIYDAIPHGQHTHRMLLLADGVRGESRRHYYRFHESLYDAGVRSIAVILTGPRERTAEWGTMHYGDEYVLIHTVAGTSRDDLAQSMVNARLFDDVAKARSELTKLDNGWFLWFLGGDARSIQLASGSEAHAEEWGRLLADAGKGSIRSATRVKAEAREVLLDAARAMGDVDAALGHALYHAVDELENLTWSISIGNTREVRGRLTFVDADQSQHGIGLLEELRETLRSRSKIALAMDEALHSVSPGTVDTMFDGVRLSRSGRTVEIAVGWEPMALLIEVLCATPLAEEILEEIAYAMGMGR